MEVCFSEGGGGGGCGGCVGGGGVKDSRWVRFVGSGDTLLRIEEGLFLPIRDQLRCRLALAKIKRALEV